MLIINRHNKHGVDFREIWYAEKSCGLKGVNLYRGASKPIGKELRKPRTLLTDLTRDMEDITADFRKNTRYEIRRAEREGITTSIKLNGEITPEDIESFCRFFVEFWKRKNMEAESYDKYYGEIDTYVKNKAFAISRAFDREGTFLAVHTYIVGDDFVRFYQSASALGDNKELNALIGNANRYLHYKDMEYFREKGILTYDWGGAGLSEDVKAITGFKEGFGGKEHYYYDSREALGIKAAAVEGLIDFIGMIT